MKTPRGFIVLEDLYRTRVSIASIQQYWPLTGMTGTNIALFDASGDSSIIKDSRPVEAIDAAIMEAQS